MGLAAGIIGLPNVGKSTIFNALCSGKALAENYPFCTIDPNHGVVAIPDHRPEKIAARITTARIVPAFLELIDIAGLVKGASKGEGLGNQFLGHIKDANAIVHVVRCFDDADVVHVDGSVDPVRDIEIVETELMLKDFDTAERGLDRVSKAAKSGARELKSRVTVYERVRNDLAAGIPVRKMNLTVEEKAAVAEMNLLSVKPVLYVANMSDPGSVADRGYADTVRDFASRQGALGISICGKVEAEIAELPEEDRCGFLEELGLQEPGLHVLTRAAYQLLSLQTFFTVNEKELHSWNLPIGSTAPQAAGTVHSDFEKGFVRADVYTVSDLEILGSEAALRAAGKIRSEGREYLVQDGDILFFKFTS